MIFRRKLVYILPGLLFILAWGRYMLNHTSSNVKVVNMMGKSKVSFKVPKQDSVLLSTNTLSSIKTKSIIYTKHGRKSVYYLNDNSGVYVFNMLLGNKVNFEKDYLLKPVNPLHENDLFVVSYEFRDGFFYISDVDHKAKFLAFDKNQKVRIEKRGKNFLYLSGNPGFIDFRNSLSEDKPHAGFFIEDKRSSLELVVMNTEDGVTVIVYQPSKNPISSSLYDLLARDLLIVN